jgi:simple sugar transport system ATP-binding protein
VPSWRSITGWPPSTPSRRRWTTPAARCSGSPARGRPRSGWIRTGRVQRLAQDLIARFNVKAGGPDATAKSLSGGNLQKFIVGREIESGPRLLIISQPTWGVDVGAAAQIRSELLRLRNEGCAVLVVSEELDELFEISDRLVVMAGGRLSPSLAVGQASRATVGEWMSGLWEGAVHAQA